MVVNYRLVKQAMAVFIFVSIGLWGFSAQGADTSAAGKGSEEVARPSNPGGPGEAVNLSGNLKQGKAVYKTTCMGCHGTEAKGGLPNPGSSDGTIPPLNPIDETMYSKDYKTFAQNIDLFIQHGSTPEGPNPAISMPAWGDKKQLTQQQIADVIAYIIHLNTK